MQLSKTSASFLLLICFVTTNSSAPLGRKVIHCPYGKILHGWCVNFQATDSYPHLQVSYLDRVVLERQLWCCMQDGAPATDEDSSSQLPLCSALYFKWLPTETRDALNLLLTTQRTALKLWKHYFFPDLFSSYNLNLFAERKKLTFKCVCLPNKS